MEDKDMGHRKFLKLPKLTYDLGTFLPIEVKLYQDQDPIDLSWLSHTRNGSALFFLSSHCTACNSEAVIEAIHKYPEFSYAIFHEGFESSLGDQEQSMLDKGVKLYSFNIDFLEKNLKIGFVPFQLVLNRVGQVVASGINNSLENIDAIIQPLVRSVERNKNE